MRKLLNGVAFTVVLVGCSILGSFAWIWATETYPSVTPAPPAAPPTPTIHASDGMAPLPPQPPQRSIDEPSNWHDRQALQEAAATLALLDYWDLKDRHGSGLEYPDQNQKDQYAIHLRDLSQREGRSIVHVSNVVEVMMEQIQEAGKTGSRLHILSGLNQISRETDGYSLEEMAAKTLAVVKN